MISIPYALMDREFRVKERGRPEGLRGCPPIISVQGFSVALASDQDIYATSNTAAFCILCPASPSNWVLITVYSCPAPMCRFTAFPEVLGST